MKQLILIILLFVATVLDNFTLKLVHAEPMPMINKVYEDRGVQNKVEISLHGVNVNIKRGSKGKVYTIDEDDKTESLIADIEVFSITPDGIAHAKRIKGSNSIKIKKGDIVRFEGEILPKDTDEEIQENKKLLKSNPNDPITHYNLGLLYEEKGMLDDSLTSYKRASELNPSMVKPLIGQGNVLNKKGESDKAISLFKKAIEIHPGYAETYEGLGLVYVNTRQSDDALKAFQKAINLNPGLVNSRYNLGILYAKKAQFNEAIAEWTKAIGINPQKTEIHYNLGIAYVKIGELDDAICVWQKALEANPSMSPFHYLIGLAYKEKGDFYKAVASLKNALEIDSSFAEIHKALEDLYRSRGLMEDADREARLYKSKSNTVKVTDASNLKLIGLGINMYINDHNGELPDNLAILIKEEYISLLDVFHSPASDKDVSIEMLEQNKGDYIYFGKGKSEAFFSGGDIPFAVTRPDLFPGNFVNILFSDGHVEACKDYHDNPVLMNLLREERK